MKKTLLLVAAATFATTSFAQRSAAVDFSSFNTKAALTAEEYPAEEVSFMKFAPEDKHKVSANATVKAWYNRPDGAFYLSCYSTEGKASYSSWYAPYLVMHPYADYTFESASTGAAVHSWKVWYQESMQPKSQVVSAVAFTNSWNLELDSVPRLTVLGTDNTASVYQLGGYNGTTAYVSSLSTYPNYPGQLSPTTTVRHAWASPKFFAAKSNRDGTVSAGSYYATVKDDAGAAAGNLLGRNTLGIDAMAVAVEKPTHPYAINAVGVRFQSLQMASDDAEATFVANIYKLSEIPAYGTSFVKVTPGEKIASVSLKVSNAMILTTPEFLKSSTNGKYSGIMRFPLESPLNVEEPILVEVTGYNTEAVTDFTSLYSADYFDEGKGELGYVKKDGVYMGIRGSYISTSRYTAPAVMMEVENPFLVWNYSSETGEAAFNEDGGEKSVEVFTYHPAAEMTLTSEDGSPVPAWVGASVSDDMSSGEFGYLSYLKVNVQPLPAGTASREAYVKIAYPGAKLVYHVVQKAEQTSITDVAESKSVKAQKVVENGQVL
ncbi:MAG: hypothetical protein Q4E41_07675, partial [Bacteroidales bacterium]|nr:hypothetical protein [Bacteroidales bacterium]